MGNSISEKKIYLPGLHGLRFFAAFAVIITHVELFKARYNLPNLYHLSIIKDLGTIGVNFFFVLSGFLITFLLLKEQEKKNTISIKKFYLRRILRIWPLYYFLIFLVFFALPFLNFPELPGLNIESNFTERFVLFSLFLPNVSKAVYEFVPYGGILWSVGVEEQFYLIWPLVISISTKYFRNILGVIIFFITIKIFAISPIVEDVAYISNIQKFLAMMRLEIMGIGGLGAYIYYKKLNAFLNIIYHRVSQLAIYIIFFLVIFFLPQELNDGKHIILSLLFLVIILNVSTNPYSLVKLENQKFNFLGNISYGIYMYHMIVAGGLIFLLRKLEFNNTLFNVLLYISTLCITILVSHLSFKFLETPFLRMKDKFTVVSSGLGLAKYKQKKYFNISNLKYGKSK